MEGYRVELKPYVNQRLECRGIYDGQGTAGVTGRPVFKTALFNEIVITTPDGHELELEHLWVQFAEDIVNAKPMRGDVIEFTAVVNSYHHQARNCEAWGLTKARDVVMEREREAYRTPLLPPPPTQYKPCDKPAEVPPFRSGLSVEEGPTREPVTPKEAVRAVKEILKGFSDNGGGVQLATLKWVVENHHNLSYTIGLVGGVEEFLELAEILG